MKQVWTREEMAQKVAARMKNGYCVNLGFGMPMMVPNFLPKDVTVMIQAEDGLLGYGPRVKEGDPKYDYDVADAGGVPVSALPGMSIVGHDGSFAMIRGGHLDMTVLGALQVSEQGDLANWKLPEKKVGSMGGAMDLVAGAKTVVVMMEHALKDGTPKIVKKCTYPITGLKCVDLIISELAVIEVTAKGLVVTQMAPEYTLADIQKVTEPTLKAGPGIK
jgi:3-oxoacid CoA-transferase subunit B